MELFIAFLMGVLIYHICAVNRKKTGKLIIDLSENATQPVVFKFNEGLNQIYTKRIVTFDVEVIEDDSLN